MSRSKETVRGILGKLARDSRGNMIMISAAAIIPLLGFMGAAIDISRTYVVKSRMQNACDAGALAGRRNMKGAVWTPEAQSAARSFFDTNFPAGSYGSTDLAVTYSANTNLVVTGLAQANVPTSIMRLFGKQLVKVEVSCDAEMQVPNTDVMFVLDTTGSMADINAGDTVAKIVALRAAVTNFFTALESAKSSAAQVRYGFVPYATTVNVGGLLQRDWMVDKWTYQSRVPNGITVKETTTTTAGVWTYGGWTKLAGTSESLVSYRPLEDCVAPTNTAKTTNTYTPNVVTKNDDGTETTVRELTQLIKGSNYSVGITGGKCKLTETRYTDYQQKRTETYLKYKEPIKTTSSSNVYNWIYKPVEYDVSVLKGANADGTMKVNTTITATINNNHAPRTVTWKGCIEERDTVRTTNYAPLPAAANDLNIDLVPSKTDPKTQWRPALGQLVYARKSITNWYMPDDPTSSNYTNIGDHLSGFYASCPTAARKLSTLTLATLTTYLNSLVPSGNTYHDIGFIWGMRLLSNKGIFASENATAPNGGNISRNIIFMTDGNTDTDIINYDAYGLSALDRRRTDVSTLPTNAGQNTIVEERLKALCTEAKNRSITVWVIAFGTDLTSLLQNCASTGRAFQADNAVELNETFAKIAGSISQLRLTR